jgi:hypothetical protein
MDNHAIQSGFNLIKLLQRQYGEKNLPSIVLEDKGSNFFCKTNYL